MAGTPRPGHEGAAWSPGSEKMGDWNTGLRSCFLLIWLFICLSLDIVFVREAI